mmetsp:Transcript_51093/g.170551  ORF Transcript_51093/g.170551 Transcript_51093/m.170551 type:complete len:809 (+) Transcript_51093:1298-3724(+)
MVGQPRSHVEGRAECGGARTRRDFFAVDLLRHGCGGEVVGAPVGHPLSVGEGDVGAKVRVGHQATLAEDAAHPSRAHNLQTGSDGVDGAQDLRSLVRCWPRGQIRTKSKHELTLELGLMRGVDGYGRAVDMAKGREQWGRARAVAVKQSLGLLAGRANFPATASVAAGKDGLLLYRIAAGLVPWHILRRHLDHAPVESRPPQRHAEARTSARARKANEAARHASAVDVAPAASARTGRHAARKHSRTTRTSSSRHTRAHATARSVLSMHARGLHTLEGRHALVRTLPARPQLAQALAPAALGVSRQGIIPPTIRARPVGRLGSKSGVAVGPCNVRRVLPRELGDEFAPRLAQLPDGAHRTVDIDGRVAVHRLRACGAEDVARRARILDGLVSALAERGVHGAGGVAEEHHAAAVARLLDAARQHRLLSHLHARPVHLVRILSERAEDVPAERVEGALPATRGEECAQPRLRAREWRDARVGARGGLEVAKEANVQLLLERVLRGRAPRVETARRDRHHAHAREALAAVGSKGRVLRLGELGGRHDAPHLVLTRHIVDTAQVEGVLAAEEGLLILVRHRRYQPEVGHVRRPVRHHVVATHQLTHGRVAPVAADEQIDLHLLHTSILPHGLLGGLARGDRSRVRGTTLLVGVRCRTVRDGRLGSMTHGERERRRPVTIVAHAGNLGVPVDVSSARDRCELACGRQVAPPAAHAVRGGERLCALVAGKKAVAWLRDVAQLVQQLSRHGMCRPFHHGISHLLHCSRERRIQRLDSGDAVVIQKKVESRRESTTCKPLEQRDFDIRVLAQLCC